MKSTQGSRGRSGPKSDGCHPGRHAGSSGRPGSRKASALVTMRAPRPSNRRKPAWLQAFYVVRRRASLGAGVARQAGGHWFEPSSAHSDPSSHVTTPHGCWGHVVSVVPGLRVPGARPRAHPPAGGVIAAACVPTATNVLSPQAMDAGVVAVAEQHAAGSPPPNRQHPRGTTKSVWKSGNGAGGVVAPQRPPR